MVQVKPKPFIRISLLWLSWVVIFQALAGCHDNLILGKSPLKWRHRPDKTLAVDWDVKHQLKRKKKKKRKEKCDDIDFDIVNFPSVHIV